MSLPPLQVRLGDQTGMVPDNFLDPIKPSAAAPTQSTAPKKPVPMQPSPPAEVKPDPVLPPREVSVAHCGMAKQFG